MGGWAQHGVRFYFNSGSLLLLIHAHIGRCLFALQCSWMTCGQRETESSLSWSEAVRGLGISSDSLVSGTREIFTLVGRVLTLSCLWTFFFLCFIQNIATFVLPDLGLDFSQLNLTLLFLCRRLVATFLSFLCQSVCRNFIVLFSKDNISTGQRLLLFVLKDPYSRAAFWT